MEFLEFVSDTRDDEVIVKRSPVAHAEVNLCDVRENRKSNAVLAVSNQFHVATYQPERGS